MDHLIYTAYSGLSASMVQQRVIANNMANTQTTGFRAELLAATPTTIKGTGLEARAMTDAEVRGANMRQGEMMQTNNPLDVAMNGDTMMAVQASDGSEGYTRRGDLSIDANDTMVNGEGLPVLSETGPITVPEGMKLSVGPDGSVLASDPTNTSSQPQIVARIKLASTTGTHVEKGLDNVFRVVGGGILPTDDNARLVSGSLEKSNVSPTQVLVDMVDAQRLFEMRAKVVATAKDNDEKSTALMSLPS
jgi:flagellar basal-body rod protein FlgF